VKTTTRVRVRPLNRCVLRSNKSTNYYLSPSKEAQNQKMWFHTSGKFTTHIFLVLSTSSFASIEGCSRPAHYRPIIMPLMIPSKHEDLRNPWSLVKPVLSPHDLSPQSIPKVHSTEFVSVVMVSKSIFQSIMLSVFNSIN
jgi:hypothetical protein